MPSIDTERLSWFASDEYDAIKHRNITYKETPDSLTCKAGQLSQQVKDDYLLLMNNIRKLHDYDSITYDNTQDIYMQASSLIMYANSTLTHNPNSDMSCYTPEGAMSAGSSNLAYGYTNMFKTVVSGWLVDNGVSSLGHRRWLLNASATQSAFGYVGNAGTQKAFYGGWESSAPKGMKFMAYPYKEYPASLISNWRGIVAYSAPWHIGFLNGAPRGISNATVKISDEMGNILEVENVYPLDGNYGSNGGIKFTPKDWKVDTHYKVEVILKDSTYTYSVYIDSRY